MFTPVAETGGFYFHGLTQRISQDLETGCPKLTMVKFCGILKFSREATIYSDYFHKYVFNY